MVRIPDKIVARTEKNLEKKTPLGINPIPHRTLKFLDCLSYFVACALFFFWLPSYVGAGKFVCKNRGNIFGWHFQFPRRCVVLNAVLCGHSCTFRLSESVKRP